MKKGSGLRQGLSIALRMGTEMVVATFVGAIMGYFLDQFLGTKPWCLVAGLLFGGAAGCLSIYRAAQEISFNDNNDQEGDV